MKKNPTGILSILAIIALAAVIISIPLIKPKNLRKEYDGDFYNSGIIDESGIFDYDSETLFDLETMVQEYSEELEMNICIYLAGYQRSDEETENFSCDKYDEIFGEDSDGVFYYIDTSYKSPAYDYLVFNGKQGLTHYSHIESIFSYLDNFLPSSGQLIHASQIEEAIQHFCYELEEYNDYSPNSIKFERDKVTKKYYFYMDGEYYVSRNMPPTARFLILAASLVIGGIVLVICYFSIKKAYKFKSSANPSVYVSHEETKFTEKSDIFIRSYVSKHKIQSSSGGGRGGGRSGGGRGGGHHR